MCTWRCIGLSVEAPRMGRPQGFWFIRSLDFVGVQIW